MNPAPDYSEPHELARAIFASSRKCLMAHTLRAVEEHIRGHSSKKSYPIIVRVVDGMLPRYARISWTLFTPQYAYILVDKGLSHDHKRVCIAHECYHILHGQGTHIPRPDIIEDSADIFANDLCRQHNNFYRDPESLKHCQFSHLPIKSRNPVS
jgi:hypothetical protein